MTSGDYLSGFLLGTRKALYENERESITLTIDRISAYKIGVLVALFERTVGLYAYLININAYHQPGVEAGKKAASEILVMQRQVVNCLSVNKTKSLTADQIALQLGVADDAETVFKICEHLAANSSFGIQKTPSLNPILATYRMA